MQDEKWQETIGRIQDTFRVLNHEITRGDAESGDVETIDFETPAGKMRLERTSKPRVIGKTALGSKRIGGSVSVQYEYSASEKVHTVKAYRWNDGSATWAEIDAQRGGFSL